MSSLLLRNLRTILTCDDGDAVLEHADLYCENGIIRGLGPDLPQTADTVIDGSHYWCYPGLINTHHHLYQVFSRNLPQVQNLELFDWLTALYEIWKGLDEQVVRLSSLTGMGELLKHGCTTCFDHHYVFPAGCGDLIGAQFAAAEELGMRMFASRGSMDLSRKDGGLPPDSVVQTVDAIMKDSARVIEAYHDPSFGSMRQVALAPCSPSPSAESCCGRAPSWPGSTASGSTPTCVRRGTRSTTPWSTTASGRWSTWRPWGGQARTCGMPTASTSTTRSCGSSPAPAPAWPTAPSAT